MLSKTGVAELGERLWDDYQEFIKRDLGEYEIAYLFVDGIAERLLPGQRLEAIADGLPQGGRTPCGRASAMAAWGFTLAGAKLLLHLMPGSKEGEARPCAQWARVGAPNKTVSAFFQDMRTRGLGDPLLLISDVSTSRPLPCGATFEGTARRQPRTRPIA